MEGEESFSEAFINEFVASSRVVAVDLLGEEDVATMDKTIKEFVEEENEYDPENAIEFLRAALGQEAIRFNPYPLVSFASATADKENLDGDLEKKATRTIAIIRELKELSKNE